jgi:pseudaminic acid synthase|tara:strand:- start:1608 stop:2612 length:1005 start_codon:yes stop_codon:yes gene_type:complete
MKKPFFVAEISANHNGKIQYAKKLILTAKKFGADAVKVQTFTQNNMTINSNKKNFIIKMGLWKGYKLWDLYNKAQTPLSWHKEIFDYAKKNKIKIFSTPFDEQMVDFLEKLNCPMYKIASFEMNDLNLVKKIALTKKPIILSTGLASMREITNSVNTAKKHGAKDITLLYCVSNYPSNNSDFNLYNIKILKDTFKCRIGLSDHSTNNKIANLALVMGAEIFEKHIALAGQRKGLDIEFSLKGKQIKYYKDELVETYNLIKKKYFFRSKDEKRNLIFRRSIYAIKDIKRGEIFSKYNIKCLRPAIGLSADKFLSLLGKKSRVKLKKFQLLRKNFI